MYILVNRETKIIEGVTSTDVTSVVTSHDVVEVATVPENVNGNYKYENGEIVEVV